MGVLRVKILLKFIIKAYYKSTIKSVDRLGRAVVTIRNELSTLWSISYWALLKKSRSIIAISGLVTVTLNPTNCRANSASARRCSEIEIINGHFKFGGSR